MTRIPVRIQAILAAAVLAAPAALLAQSFTVHKYTIGGEGGTDYLTADPASGRVFVSRSTHVMVVEGASGKVVGDIPDTPRMHGIALAPKWNHGFTTNAGDSTVTMFDLKTLAVIKKIHAGIDGLDGIMYDDGTDRIVTTNHSRPMGSATIIDPKDGTVVATVMLTGGGPEGAVGNAKGRIFVNLEDKNALDVIDTKTWKVIATWPIAPCDGPTGIAMDRAANRIFSGCGKTSVVTDASTGKVVAEISNGNGVDALGWDQSQKFMYIPAGRDGNVTVVHEDSPDKYTVIATVATQPGAKTISVDPMTHTAYLFQPEYGPPPAPPAGTTPDSNPRRRPRGPMIGTWFISITH